jgi:hypothetical protein
MVVACAAWIHRVAELRAWRWEGVDAISAEGRATMLARGMEEASRLVVLGAALGVPAAILAVVGLVRAVRASRRAAAREP